MIFGIYIVPLKVFQVSLFKLNGILMYLLLLVAQAITLNLKKTIFQDYWPTLLQKTNKLLY